MSNELLNLVWPVTRAPSSGELLTPSRKACLIALADAANDQGEAWPAIVSKRGDRLDLVTRTCLGERTVQEALSWLEANHFITRRRTRDGSVYTVHLDCLTRSHCGSRPATIADTDKSRPADAAPRPADAAPRPAVTADRDPQSLHPNHHSNHQQSSGKQLAGSRARKRGSVIQDDWQPKPLTEKMANKVAHWSTERIERELAKFINHHSEKQTVSPDWDARWRTWVLNSLDYEERRNDRNQARNERAGRDAAIPSENAFLRAIADRRRARRA